MPACSRRLSRASVCAQSKFPGDCSTEPHPIGKRTLSTPPCLSRWNCSTVGVACGATPQNFAGSAPAAGASAASAEQDEGERRRPRANPPFQASLPLRHRVSPPWLRPRGACPSADGAGGTARRRRRSRREPRPRSGSGPPAKSRRRHRSSKPVRRCWSAAGPRAPSAPSRSGIRPALATLPGAAVAACRPDAAAATIRVRRAARFRRTAAGAFRVARLMRAGRAPRRRRCRWSKSWQADRCGSEPCCNLTRMDWGAHLHTECRSSPAPGRAPENKPMPAEPTLTTSQAARGPGAGSIDGAGQSSRARLDQTAALLAPVVLIVGLALAGGGFDVTSRHIAGLGVWLVVVAMLVLGAGSRVRLAWPFYWAAGLIVGLALLSALSSLWSGSMELSVIEADRVLVYLGFFLAAFLIAQTDVRRQGFAEGLTIALAVVVVLGLGSRLLPHVIEVSESARQRPTPALPARLLERERRDGGHRGGDAALEQQASDLGRPALALGGGDPGGAADPLLHLLARRAALPDRRHRLPAGPLPRPALAAGHAGDRRPGRGSGDPRGAGEKRASPTTCRGRRRSTRARPSS